MAGQQQWSEKNWKFKWGEKKKVWVRDPGLKMNRSEFTTQLAHCVMFLGKTFYPLQNSLHPNV